MDETTLPLGCPECGKEFEVPAARIEHQAAVVCPACGVAFEVSHDRASREALDKLADLDRAWDDLAKR